MDPLDLVETLARQARKDSAPAFDVTGVVLGRVGRRPAARMLPLSLFAATAALAASVVLAVAVYSLLAEPDPLASLAAPLQEAMLW